MTVLVQGFKKSKKKYMEIIHSFLLVVHKCHKQRIYAYGRDHGPHRKSYSMLFH